MCLNQNNCEKNNSLYEKLLKVEVCSPVCASFTVSNSPGLFLLYKQKMIWNYSNCFFAFRCCSGQYSVWAGAAGSPHLHTRPHPTAAASIGTGNTGAGESVPVSGVLLLHHSHTINPWKMSWADVLFSLPSRSSVDYVAPTPDNFSHTPLIVPSSPTELEDENGKSALLSQFGFRHGISWWIKLTSLCIVRCWFTNGYVTASGWQGSRRKGRANGNRGRPQATTICIYSHIPKFPWFCFRANSLCTVPARVLSCMSFTLYFQQPI